MSIGLIVLGIFLLIPTAWLALQLLVWLGFTVLANNWHEYFIVPAIILTGIGGIGCLLYGFGVL